MYQSISMDEFYQKAKREKLAIIDVREADEYTQGHIPNVPNYPLSTLPQKAADLDNQTDYYVICQSGNRSAQACAYLAKVQHLQVTNVLGGMSAWKGAITHEQL